MDLSALHSKRLIAAALFVAAVLVLAVQLITPSPVMISIYRVVLDAGGELPQREIVEGTDLSKATVSRTLDTLESKNLLERKRNGMGNVVVLK